MTVNILVNNETAETENNKEDKSECGFTYGLL